jgi:hypothetical protein
LSRIDVSEAVVVQVKLADASPEDAERMLNESRDIPNAKADAGFPERQAACR